MSEAAPSEKTTAPAATAEKPAVPAEPPFNTDDLQSSTARFTHKAWHLYYSNRKDLTFIREALLRANLKARSVAGAEALETLLQEAGAQAMSRQGDSLAFTATFEMIQKIIKNPETYQVDAVKI